MSKLSAREYFAILEPIKTVEQAASFKIVAEDLKDSLYQSHTNLNVLLKRLSLGITGKFEDYLRQKNISVKTPKLFQELLEDLTNLVSNWPVLTLELAYEPTNGLVEQISTWLEKNFTGTKFLLDFTLNPSVVAGARIYFQGRVGDYSLRKEFDDKKI